MNLERAFTEQEQLRNLETIRALHRGDGAAIVEDLRAIVTQLRSVLEDYVVPDREYEKLDPKGRRDKISETTFDLWGGDFKACSVGYPSVTYEPSSHQTGLFDVVVHVIAHNDDEDGDGREILMKEVKIRLPLISLDAVAAALRVADRNIVEAQRCRLSILHGELRQAARRVGWLVDEIGHPDAERAASEKRLGVRR